MRHGMRRGSLHTSIADPNVHPDWLTVLVAHAGRRMTHAGCSSTVRPRTSIADPDVHPDWLTVLVVDQDGAELPLRHQRQGLLLNLALTGQRIPAYRGGEGQGMGGAEAEGVRPTPAYATRPTGGAVGQVRGRRGRGAAWSAGEWAVRADS